MHKRQPKYNNNMSSISIYLALQLLLLFVEQHYIYWKRQKNLEKKHKEFYQYHSPFYTIVSRKLHFLTK